MRRSETARYPEGLAHVAMVNLRDKFYRTDALSATVLRQYLSKLKWKEDADPIDFFEGLMNVEILSTDMASDFITKKSIGSASSFHFNLDRYCLKTVADRASVL